jgi:hypothetical protein
MKFSKFIFIFLVIAFCITDCKKYPDGPFISFRGKEARVIGDWEIESFLIDGNDSLSQLTCTSYSFYKNDDTTNRHFHSSESCPAGSGGDWGIKNHGKELVLYVSIDSGAVTPFPINGTLTGYPKVSNLSWEIQRLKNRQMWLKTSLNNKEYYIKLKQ